MTGTRRIDVHDESGKINRSLWFIVIILALGVAIGVDGGSIIYTRFQVESEALDAAATGAGARGSNGYQKAVESVADDGITFAPEDYEYDAKTGAVTVTLSKPAGTMFVKYIDPIKDWAIVKVTKTALPNNA